MSANKKIKGTRPGGTHVTGPGKLGPEAFAAWYRRECLAQWKALDLDGVAKTARAVVEAQEKGRTVWVIGNGGSAATASHVATDFSKTAEAKGRPPIRCVSLTDNLAYITAIGNDLSYDDIFSRQMENLVKKNDVVILITGSGNSPNLLRAAELARKRGALTVGWLGFDGGKLKRRVDIPLLIASDQYGVIEDFHMSLCHIITFYLKQR